MRIDIVAITAFNADTLVLGESLLGVDWVLGPSDRFARYAFNIVVSQVPARPSFDRRSRSSGLA